MNVMYQGGVINTEDEGNDLPGFKGILARWLGKLVYEGGQTQYLDWMEKNAQTAWRNRNSSDIMWTRWADKTQDTLYRMGLFCRGLTAVELSSAFRL